MRNKNIMIFLALIFAIIVGVTVYVNTTKFGSLPKGEYLERIKKSPNYRDGKFQNISVTPQMAEGYNFLGVMFDFLFKSHPNTKPQKPIPTEKTDLQKLKESEDVLVWMGHSTYFVQVSGKKFLIDPVLSKIASPVPFSAVAFEGTSIYQADDFPEIDYIIISHDHWDHLDYPTVIKLKDKTKKFVCGLGVGAHLRHWGIPEDKIIEMDWNEDTKEEGVNIYCFPARHFSGRGLVANKSLWASFLVETPDYRFYIGGDTGYDTHYAEIGKKFSSIDFVALDSGQYDKAWRYIHEQPNEIILAAKDLKAKNLLPVHNSKFTISNHPWNEPLEILSKAGEDEAFDIWTPKIGQKVELRQENKKFEKWWIY